MERKEVRSLALGYPVGRRGSVSQGPRKKRKTKISKLDDESEKEVRSLTEFHEPLNFLITILVGVFALHSRGVGTSPLMEYDAMMPFFIMAVVIYGTAFLGIKLGPQNADYIPILRFVCVTSAILAFELLASSLVDPLRLLVINICGILVELLRRWYKQILTWKFNRFSLSGDTKKQDQDAGGQIEDHIV